MNTDCGCKILSKRLLGLHYANYIEYCPLHKAATSLYNACMAAGDWMDCQRSTPSERTLRGMIREAILIAGRPRRAGVVQPTFQTANGEMVCSICGYAVTDGSCPKCRGEAAHK